jgi:radical SAM superfamily enzyme YgiQ (UPF0313 family)
VVKIALVQAGDNFGGQYYLPFSMGILQAYARAHLPSYPDFDFLPVIYSREPLANAVERLSPADVAFFSSYVWNHHYNLELACLIKKHRPRCVVVFGGPQVPEGEKALEEMLRRHPFIDLCCYGEGEVAFTAVLANSSGRVWESVPSSGFLDQMGRFVLNSPAPRISDVDTIPSPYLSGIFDSLIANNPEQRWSVLIETNRGCPFSCAYCTWGSPNRRAVFKWNLSRVMAEIDWISAHRIEFVFCCDANFGLFAKRDLAIVRKVAENKARFGFPKALSVQSTKNATETIFALNKVLHEAGLQKGVNLALQSVNPATLANIGRRNISGRTYSELQELFASAGIATFSDIILGLPSESYDTFADGVSSIISGGQHNRIQFINLSVLENSQMASEDFQKRFGMVIRECRAVGHHTSIDASPEIAETQMLVVGTAEMPPADWVRARVFCWLTSLLHFNKLLQIPLVAAACLGGVSYRQLIEPFVDPGPGRPVLEEIINVLRGKAVAIQQGDGEYIPAPEWLGIYWPADEWIFIKLCREGMLEAFYREAREILSSSVLAIARNLPFGAIEDAIALNNALVRLPGAQLAEHLTIHYNVHRIFQGVLLGKQIPLEQGVFSLDISNSFHTASWEDWYREVVWYGTKRGAYLREWREVGRGP